MLRSTFAKDKPKQIFCGYHKNFDYKKFQEELKNHLSSALDFESFHLASKTTLDRFAPSKQNIVRNNHCVKSVQVQSYFWSVFSCIQTEYVDSLRLRIQSQYRKIRTRINSVFGHFSGSEQSSLQDKNPS